MGGAINVKFPLLSTVMMFCDFKFAIICVGVLVRGAKFGDVAGVIIGAARYSGRSGTCCSGLVKMLIVSAPPQPSVCLHLCGLPLPAV